MPYASDKRRALTAIFIVFLFIFSEILVAENEFNQLTDDNTTDYAIYQYSSLAEIHIDSANPDTNFNSATEVYIGENTTNLGEARALYRFGNNLSNSAHTIASAELTLTCDILSEDAVVRYRFCILQQSLLILLHQRLHGMKLRIQFHGKFPE